MTEDEASVASGLKKELLPLAFVLALQVQGTRFGRPWIALLDSGSTTTWINKKALGKDIQGYTVPKVQGTTLAGSFSSKECVCIEGLSFPEFHPKQKLPKLGANVFHAECCHDVIIGRDTLRAFKIQLNFDDDINVSDGIS